ncbi:cryptic protein-like [Ambystoma mexicanum]|uniref:cryptic protein-like n=1 Tax=Ambystoma mexicanum TaxID=8296 RepID=UPI0037E7A531
MSCLRMMVAMTLLFPANGSRTSRHGCEGDRCGTEEEWTNHIASPEKLKRAHDGATGADVSVSGHTYGSTPNLKCCQNGGTCFLGSFCICPKHFSGRHCEHDMRIRSCGVLAHGQWAVDGCFWCRCGYGLLHCFRRAPEENCGTAVKAGNALHYRSEGTRPGPPASFLVALLLWSLLCVK